MLSKKNVNKKKEQQLQSLFCFDATEPIPANSMSVSQLEKGKVFLVPRTLPSNPMTQTHCWCLSKVFFCARRTRGVATNHLQLTFQPSSTFPNTIGFPWHLLTTEVVSVFCKLEIWSSQTKKHGKSWTVEECKRQKYVAYGVLAHQGRTKDRNTLRMESWHTKATQVLSNPRLTASRTQTNEHSACLSDTWNNHSVNGWILYGSDPMALPETFFISQVFINTKKKTLIWTQPCFFLHYHTERTIISKRIRTQILAIPWSLACVLTKVLYHATRFYATCLCLDTGPVPSDKILCYFCFPALGRGVALRENDILIFNPQVYYDRTLQWKCRSAGPPYPQSCTFLGSRNPENMVV